jgi:hypothetical protein
VTHANGSRSVLVWDRRRRCGCRCLPLAGADVRRGRQTTAQDLRGRGEFQCSGRLVAGRLARLVRRRRETIGVTTPVQIAGRK